MVSPSLRPDFVAFSMWLMFSYNFELCILSSYFSFYPQRAQLLLNKTKQDVSRAFFVWFHLLLYLNGYLFSYSSGIRNPHVSPRLTCFCLSTSHSLANCHAKSTVLDLSVSLSNFCLFLRFRRLYFPPGVHFLNAYPPGNLSADPLCRLFTLPQLVHRPFCMWISGRQVAPAFLFD